MNYYFQKKGEIFKNSYNKRLDKVDELLKN